VQTGAEVSSRASEWWRATPAYESVGAAEFLDHRWQSAHAPADRPRLLAVLAELGGRAFADEAAAALRTAPMAVRVTPYLLSLIDWSDPAGDPIRRQFVPMAAELRPDHPMLRLDSLDEQADMPVPGLVHRYPDRALLVALDVCPVYCAFCTRSYAVGADTPAATKAHMPVDTSRWDAAFAYLERTPAVEDVVVSGGDVYQLPARHLRLLVRRLLGMRSIRRVRLATRGPAVMPMKLLSDDAWFRAVADLAAEARAARKELSVHTHVNHPRELTEVTEAAANRLFDAGVEVRNQCVLLRGVNDDGATMLELTRRLSALHFRPYYAFQHDMVPRCEHLRTPLSTALSLEKALAGATAGFNTPRFVVDVPGGGGKRGVHSYEHYSVATGISVYSAPAVKPRRPFLYFDPLDALDDDMRHRWASPGGRTALCRAAVEEAGMQAGAESVSPRRRGPARAARPARDRVVT
jgi:lysine 2,3-aminomutase